MSLVLEAHGENGSCQPLALRPHALLRLGSALNADLCYREEPRLSAFQAELRLKGETLTLRKAPRAVNPIYIHGSEQSHADLSPGDFFVVGNTRFVLVHHDDELSPNGNGNGHPHTEVAERPLPERLRLLSLLELPEILRLRSSDEALAHVASMLRLITEARWVEISSPDGFRVRDAAEDNVPMPDADPALLEQAHAKSPHPVHAGGPEGAWCIACVLPVSGERELQFVVQGSDPAGVSLQEKSRFTGLIADMAARNLGLKRLEDFKQKLERYFSGPVVSKILDSADPAELEPRLARATILFFDIRGFSRLAEQESAQALAGVQELRRVMTAMTEEIFSENGVVIQYMGDGILACWNVPYEDPQAEDHACRAALKMVARLRETAPQWHCGIGIHTGDIVAGSLGSEQVFSYNVMGTVVNQASRVEGITKVVEAPILVTSEVAKRLLPGTATSRRVGKFQPVGMETALELFQLSPAGAEDPLAGNMEMGLQAFERGEWEKAYNQLDTLPAGDLPARYLKALAEMHRRKPPKDWKGVIELEGK
jgi:adenylate cyclase